MESSAYLNTYIPSYRLESGGLKMRNKKTFPYKNIKWVTIGIIDALIILDVLFNKATIVIDVLMLTTGGYGR